MEKPTRKKWARRQREKRIIEIAKEIIFKKGYDGFTIEEIAREAEYTKRALYTYFKDRDEIFLAVVLQGQEILKEKLKKALHLGEGGESALERLGRAFYDFSIAYPDYFNIIMIYESKIHVYYDVPEIDETQKYRALCRESSMEYGEIAIEAIEIDKKAKRTKSPLSSKQLMLILWGQIFGVMQIILMRKSLFKDSYGIEHSELFEHFLNMVGKGLM